MSVTSLAFVVFAHALADPRVLVIVPSAGKVEVRLNDLEQPGEASVKTRRQFDGDRDGVISEAEAVKLQEFLVTRATWNLKVRQNGAALPLETAAATTRGGVGPVDAPDPLSTDVVLRATPKAKKGRVAIEVADSRSDAHPVRAAVLGDGVRIVRASQGSAEGTVVTGIELSKDAPLRLEWEVSGK